MGAEEKKKFNDNAWFVGVTPRRDPEIVVAVLYQGGGWGWHSGLLAAQVIKAYVEKQRTTADTMPRYSPWLTIRR